MATTRGTTPLPRRRSTAVAPQEPREPGDVETVVDELGGKSARVVLFRRDGAEFAWLAELGGDSVQMDVIKREYGPGRYQARVYKSGEDTEPKVVSFAIADANQPNGKGAPANDQMLTLLTRMMDKLEQMAKAPAPRDTGADVLLEVVKNLGKPSRDPMLETFMTTVLPELIKSNRPAPSSDNGMDTLQLLKLLQEERNAGMEMGTRMAEVASGDSMAAVARVIGEVGGPLASALGDRMRTEAKPVTPPRALPAGQPAPNAPQPPFVADGSQLEIPAMFQPVLPEWLKAAQPFAGMVVRWAKSDTDPRRQAEWLIDMLDDELFTEIGTTFAQTDDAILALLESAMPGVTPFRSWTTRLVAELRNVHAEALQDETPEES